MSLRTDWRLLWGSTVVLAFLAGTLCPRGFSPGWAGLSKHVVFAAFLTALLGLDQIDLATGLLAPSVRASSGR